MERLDLIGHWVRQAARVHGKICKPYKAAVSKKFNWIRIHARIVCEVSKFLIEEWKNSLSVGLYQTLCGLAGSELDVLKLEVS